MMKDFDEHMQQEGGAFKLQPRKEVWERIEAELDAKKKKRRVLWYWWILPLTLAAGLGGNALLDDKNEINKKEFSKLTHEGNTAHTTPDAVLETNVEQSNNAFEQKSTEPAALPTGSVAFRTPRQVKSSNLTAENIQLSVSRVKQDVYSKEEKQTASLTSNAKLNTEEAAALSMEVNNSTMASTGQEEMKETAKESNLPVENTPLVDSLLDSTTTEKTPKAFPTTSSPKKAQWRLITGAGLHTYSYKAGPGVFTNDMRASEPLFNPTNPGSNPMALTAPQPGAGFMVGIERAQTLKNKPRWEWQAGLHYQYQTVKISTGQRRDSAVALENIGTGFSSNQSQFYYQPGTANVQTGHQHRMHLQTGMGWHLHQNRKWTLQGLVYGGFVFGADYLVPHSQQTGYIPVKNVLQKGYYGLETGIRFQPSSWAFGLYGQTNLSSSVSSNLLNKQYWRGAELRIHYQLTNIK